MTLSSSTKAAALAVLFAQSPALAQSVSEGVVANASPTAPAIAEAVMSMGASAASVSGVTGLAVAAPADLHSVALEPDPTSFGRAVHETTILPVIRMARDTGAWIASYSGAVADAAQNAGEWIVSTSQLVTAVAHDTGGWISAKSAAAANAAQGTGVWIVSGWNVAMVAAQDTGEWITTSSNRLVDKASSTFSGFSLSPDLSADLVKHVERHLRADGNSEFALLLEESGFVLTDIKVGVGLIPELAVEFRNERTLTPAEMEAFQKKIDEYVKTASGAVGYFEGLLLRNLSRAGEYTGETRISEVRIDVFPLPDIELLFDPLHYEEKKNRMLIDAYDSTKSGKEKLQAMEDRISKLETLLSNAKK